MSICINLLDIKEFHPYAPAKSQQRCDQNPVAVALRHLLLLSVHWFWQNCVSLTRENPFLGAMNKAPVGSKGSEIQNHLKKAYTRPQTLRVGNKRSVGRYVVGILTGVVIVLGPAVAIVYNTDYVKSLSKSV